MGIAMDVRPGVLFKWFGSKFNLSELMPKPLPYLPIIEPFAGSAGYSCRYGMDRQVLLAESNQRLRSFWDWLINANPEEIRAIPSPTRMQRYDYDGVTSGSTQRKSSVRLGALGGQSYETMCLSAGQIDLMRLWMFSHSGVYAFDCDHVPPFGGYWTDIVKERIASNVPKIRWWTTVLDYRELPDIEGTWVIDPPYQKLIKINKHAYNCDQIDYVELAAWVRSRKGLVIVNEGEGADWLPFRRLSERTNSNITGGTKKSVEMIWTNQENHHE
jgi:site-specific DNA-adenine methylase